MNRKPVAGGILAFIAVCAAVAKAVFETAHGLLSLHKLIAAAREYPEISIGLAIVLLAGAAAFLVIRYSRRHAVGFTTLR